MLTSEQQAKVDEMKGAGKSQEDIDAYIAEATKGAGGDDDLSKKSPEDLAKMIKDLRSESAKYRTKAKTLEDKAEEQRLAAEAEARKNAEKNGEFEKLYGDEKAKREALESRVRKIEEQTKAELADALKVIPEDKRVLIPEGLDDEAKLRHIRNLQTAGVFDPAKAPDMRPPGGAGEPTSKADFQSDSERAAYIKKNGRDKYLALPTNPPKSA